MSKKKDKKERNKEQKTSSNYLLREVWGTELARD